MQFYPDNNLLEQNQSIVNTFNSILQKILFKERQNALTNKNDIHIFF